jgi:hypothetical protein
MLCINQLLTSQSGDVLPVPKPYGAGVATVGSCGAAAAAAARGSLVPVGCKQ